jgi:DNA-binding IclR family transcriptional regulator
MIDSTQQQALYALFCLSRDTRRINARTLGAALSLTPTQAARALVELERAGLVDATRARLTMLGLATAVRLGPAATGGPRLDLRAVPRPAAAQSAEPLAAGPAAVADEPAATPALAASSYTLCL